MGARKKERKNQLQTRCNDSRAGVKYEEAFLHSLFLNPSISLSLSFCIPLFLSLTYFKLPFLNSYNNK